VGRPPLTTFYLIRHGETSWNVQHRWQGRHDVPLNPEGERQAEALARRLAAEAAGIDAIYTSDLSRAARTASIIGDALGLVPIPEPTLREIDVGEWTALGSDEIEQRYQGQLQVWRESGHTFRFPGGESVPEVRRRALQTFERIAQRHAGGTVAIVSHGVVLNTLLTELRGWDVAEAWRDGRGRLANTGLAVVEWDCMADGPPRFDVLQP